MNRLLVRLLPVAGVAVLGVLMALAWPGTPRGFALAGALAVALALGCAAGWVRGRAPLREAADDVERLAAGAAPRAFESPVGEEERRLAGALRRAAEELARRGRDGELARDRARLDGRKDAFERLAAGIAGRFADALAGIEVALSRAERAAAQGDPPASVARDLCASREALQRAIALVSGLRALAPAQEPEPSPSPVAEPVRRALELRRARAERLGVALEYAPPYADWEVRATAHTVMDAIGPLVDNALDALEESSGPLRRVAVSFARTADRVAIAVEDDGPGVDVRVRERVFDPFYSTRSGDGLGLGLLVARSAAARCGGSLTLEAREGGGTRAVVALPAATTATLRS